MTFLRNDIPKSTRQRNRRSTVEFLSALAKRDIISDQETLILAYGSVARYGFISSTLEVVLTIDLRTCSELELPIILHYLIEYLGHPNALVCGLAYTEVCGHS
jgi:serine/threonine-protein kinase ATR